MSQELCCSHPDCSVTLGLTETDLGLLCGLHLGCAMEICRSEQRLIDSEQKIAQLGRTNAALLEALVEAQRLLHLCEFTHEADIAGAERIDAAIAEAESLEKKEL